MAKKRKTKKTKAAVNSEASKPAETEAAAPGRPDPVDLALGEHWAFPTVVRCPRCRGIQTRATSTQGKVQYRQCQAPICQHRFSVRGKPI